jgi:diguanylate cyclase (GGDEF)-like protein
MMLGREVDCDICINDPSVSRHHALLRPEADGYYLLDAQSTNGTFVNKVRVRECKLHDGDDVRIGNCTYRFLASNNVEAEYHEEIYRLSILDALTQIPNRRYMLQFLERELPRAARYLRPLALVLFDIDHFKTVNDHMGHLAGDVTLRELARLIQGSVRQEGVFARYGGEEFALVLPEASIEEGSQVAERLREQVENHRFAYAGEVFSITICLGVTATFGSELVSSDEFLRHADANLYEAKRRGRNQVVAEEAHPTTPMGMLTQH